MSANNIYNININLILIYIIDNLYIRKRRVTVK